MKIKVIAIFLIIVGIGILAFPKARTFYYQQQQMDLTTQWQDHLSLLEAGEEEKEAGKTEGDGGTARQPASAENMDGMLAIEAIDLNQPILRGITAANLNRSVSSMSDAGTPGAVGNYVIAGHRSHTYARLFNRLEEVKPGDTIIVQTAADRFTYTVTEKRFVSPEDISVLQANGSDKEITLITCHPMINPTERLIIKGKILS